MKAFTPALPRAHAARLAWAICILSVTLLGAGCSRVMTADAEPAALDLNYTEWNALLARHVTDSGVDYAAIAQDPAPLNRTLAMLDTVSRATFDAWPRHQQLAFLVNAHNAYATARIVRQWPVASLQSTRMIGDARAQRNIRLLGRRWSLKSLADEAVSDRYMESRAIFLLNWGEKGCAPPAPVAATAANLTDLAESQTRRVMADPRYLTYDSQRRHVEMTPLVRWYRPAFQRDFTTVWVFLGRYLPSKQAKIAAARPPVIHYMDFDHSLNAAAPGSGQTTAR